MLSRADLSAAVFIGGMKGILDEYRLFSEFHPGLKALAIAAPGGAARELAERSGKLALPMPKVWTLPESSTANSV